MFNFQYHIPSSMPENRWNWIQHDNASFKEAASKAVRKHFRGSEFPAQTDIWIRRAVKQRKEKIRKFRAVENGREVYDIQVVREEIT